MVMLTAAGPVLIYRVLDGTGRPIGEVVQPRAKPVLGQGAGTVLLVRRDRELANRLLGSAAELRAAPAAGR